MIFLINGLAIGGIIGISLLLIVLIISYICYRIAFYNNRQGIGNNYFPGGEEYQIYRPFMKELVKEQELIPYEEISIKTRDGKKLYARYYHVEDNAPLQIQFHGYKGTGIRDFCGGNKLSRESKHNSILVDQRGHGKSDGSTICFGIKEKYDVLEWINYALNRFGKDTKIILAGVSMGAATVLMSSELDLPSNVVGIIADCPYSSPKAILTKVMKEDMHLPVKLCYPFLYLGALIFGGLKLDKKGAKEAVKKSKTPILIIHGKKDTFVPLSMSQEIIENASSFKELHIFDNAEHGISYMVDPERYASIVQGFVERILK
ncbi:MAG: alpha/beta hydrolase [Erysipelotrichaceae bacterium]|nr:alpha/beta hydrolase [Erysipelotrichaceae bacterium]